MDQRMKQLGNIRLGNLGGGKIPVLMPQFFQPLFDR